MTFSFEQSTCQLPLVLDSYIATINCFLLLLLVACFFVEIVNIVFRTSVVYGVEGLFDKRDSVIIWNVYLCRHTHRREALGMFCVSTTIYCEQLGNNNQSSRVSVDDCSLRSSCCFRDGEARGKQWVTEGTVVYWHTAALVFISFVTYTLDNWCMTKLKT